MQVTVTLTNGTGTQNIDGAAIVQAIPSNTGSLLQVDQYNGSAVEILVDESPATIATDTGNLLFSVNVVPVPLVVNASFNYDGATTAFQQGERVFIGSSYGEIIALTGSSMTLGNFVGNQLADNDFLRGQQSLCTAQINGAITYTYPQQQATYINVGRCQGLKPAVASLSSLNYIYASPKVEILYTTLTESQLNAASAAAGGGGSGMWTQSGNLLYPTTLTNDVGIGTNSPQYRLDVTDDSQAFAPFLQVGIDNGDPYCLIGNREGGDNLAYIEFSVSDFNIVSKALTDTMSIQGRAEYIAFSNTGGELMRIDGTTDNVGIATITPTSKLTVDSGDIEVVGDTNGLILESPDGTRYRVTVANGGTLTVTAV